MTAMAKPTTDHEEGDDITPDIATATATMGDDDDDDDDDHDLDHEDRSSNNDDNNNNNNKKSGSGSSLNATRDDNRSFSSVSPWSRGHGRRRRRRRVRRNSSDLERTTTLLNNDDNHNDHGDVKTEYDRIHLNGKEVDDLATMIAKRQKEQQQQQQQLQKKEDHSAINTTKIQETKVNTTTNKKKTKNRSKKKNKNQHWKFLQSTFRRLYLVKLVAPKAPPPQPPPLPPPAPRSVAVARGVPIGDDGDDLDDNVDDDNDYDDDAIEKEANMEGVLPLSSTVHGMEAAVSDHDNFGHEDGHPRAMDDEDDDDDDDGGVPIVVESNTKAAIQWTMIDVDHDDDDDDDDDDASMDDDLIEDDDDDDNRGNVFADVDEDNDHEIYSTAESSTLPKQRDAGRRLLVSPSSSSDAATPRSPIVSHGHGRGDLGRVRGSKSPQRHHEYQHNRKRRGQKQNASSPTTSISTMTSARTNPATTTATATAMTDEASSIIAADNAHRRSKQNQQQQAQQPHPLQDYIHKNNQGCTTISSIARDVDSSGIDDSLATMSSHSQQVRRALDSPRRVALFDQTHFRRRQLLKQSTQAEEFICTTLGMGRLDGMCIRHINQPIVVVNKDSTVSAASTSASPLMSLWMMTLYDHMPIQSCRICRSEQQSTGGAIGRTNSGDMSLAMQLGHESTQQMGHVIMQMQKMIHTNRSNGNKRTDCEIIEKSGSRKGRDSNSNDGGSENRDYTASIGYDVNDESNKHNDSLSLLDLMSKASTNDNDDAASNSQQSSPPSSIEASFVTAASTTCAVKVTDEEWVTQLKRRIEQVRAWDDRYALQNHPHFCRYFKMLQYGIPIEGVQNSVYMDGYDPAVMELDARKSLQSQLHLLSPEVVQNLGDTGALSNSDGKTRGASGGGDTYSTNEPTIPETVQRVIGAFRERKRNQIFAASTLVDEVALLETMKLPNLLQRDDESSTVVTEPERNKTDDTLLVPNSTMDGDIDKRKDIKHSASNTLESMDHPKASRFLFSSPAVEDNEDTDPRSPSILPQVSTAKKAIVPAQKLEPLRESPDVSSKSFKLTSVRDQQISGAAQTIGHGTQSMHLPKQATRSIRYPSEKSANIGAAGAVRSTNELSQPPQLGISRTSMMQPSGSPTSEKGLPKSPQNPESIQRVDNAPNYKRGPNILKAAAVNSSHLCTSFLMEHVDFLESPSIESRSPTEQSLKRTPVSEELKDKLEVVKREQESTLLPYPRDMESLQRSDSMHDSDSRVENGHHPPMDEVILIDSKSNAGHTTHESVEFDLQSAPEQVVGSSNGLLGMKTNTTPTDDEMCGEIPRIDAKEESTTKSAKEKSGLSNDRDSQGTRLSSDTDKATAPASIEGKNRVQKATGRDELQRLTAELAERDRTIEELRRRLKHKDSTIERLENIIHNFDERRRPRHSQMPKASQFDTATGKVQERSSMETKIEQAKRRQAAIREKLISPHRTHEKKPAPRNSRNLGFDALALSPAGKRRNRSRASHPSSVPKANNNSQRQKKNTIPREKQNGLGEQSTRRLNPTPQSPSQLRSPNGTLPEHRNVGVGKIHQDGALSSRGNIISEGGSWVTKNEEEKAKELILNLFDTSLSQQHQSILERTNCKANDEPKQTDAGYQQ